MDYVKKKRRRKRKVGPYTREYIFIRFGNRCAYTGRPLDDTREIDHVIPRSNPIWKLSDKERAKIGLRGPHDKSNLLPTFRAINQAKAKMDLDEFRKYLTNIRPNSPIAEFFGITNESPFDGEFYFEKEAVNGIESNS